ncbi:TPA: TetR/AcrR family transcriptional regulator [Photobacterium damselae]|uniref:TetR/AcrR family transcriptional regulator n=2 Tax=Photobacterium damselae subsp. damselae TaxID=85581 RepID=A0AAE8SAS5_PHODD|nr:TetR-like C-terminal domain-containing protein [Photobacterium damselae]AWK81367.1 TetR family transcriptional regulator [Photobacterium damselae]EHA1081246.1 TetR/AcrR family transcriptional regulator [Photobacterium damselae]KAB1180520.1 TetR/AcrR family transcriptional regulator [Photobacterium damselae subsp. damselae]KAB1182268.1 TetR/AcrR family transcriptional regulator [Photobacterium damselae subsp. damselae]MBA5684694.1 WHG domain-containing protein [Photobacterium damselae subsp.
MARRNDHTREELVNMTLEQVKNFLNEHPHHELSLRKVAAMIGYVPSTLVNVFGNYNLLLLHAVAQTLDEMSKEAEASMKEATSAEDALRRLAYCYLEFATQHPYRWQLIFQHTMNGEDLPEWQSERIDNMTGMLEALIRQITPNKSEDEILEASRVLWAGVHGITLLTVDDKLFTSTPVDGKALIDNLLNTYLNTWHS